MNLEEKPRRCGMPKGWRKPEGTRSPHQVRAYPDEWELIREFARLLKHGHREACEKFLSQA